MKYKSFIVLLMLFAQPTLAEESCFYLNKGKIGFTGHKSKQVVTVRVLNLPCKHTNIILTVSDASLDQYPAITPNTIYYRFETRLSTIAQYAVDWEQADKSNSVKNFANRLLSEFIQPATLPTYEAPNPREDQEIRFVITKKYYDQLKVRNLPIFSHQTYMEGGQYIVYIPELGQAIVVAYYGT
jgi:hypothetical protein